MQGQQVVSLTTRLEEVHQRAEAAEAQRAEANAALDSMRQQLAETQATSERRLQVPTIWLPIHAFSNASMLCEKLWPRLKTDISNYSFSSCTYFDHCVEKLLLKGSAAQDGQGLHTSCKYVQNRLQCAWRSPVISMLCGAGAALKGGRQLQPGGRDAAGGAGDLRKGRAAR